MKRIINILFIFSVLILYAQKKDTLEHRLSQVETADEKTEILYKLVEKYENIDVDKTKGYIDLILTIAINADDEEAIFKACIKKGYFLYKRGDFKKSLEIFNRADSIANKLSDIEKHAHVLYAKGRSMYFLGDYVTCNKYFIEAAKIQDSLGNTIKVVNAYNGLALIQMEQKKYEEALKYINIAEEKSIEADGVANEAVLSSKGIILKELKQYDKSIEYHNKTLATSIKKNDLYAMAKDYNNLAAVYAIKKDYKTASELYENALKIKRELKDKSGEAITLVGYAMILFEEGNLDKAILLLEESLTIAYKVGNKDLLTYIFGTLTDAYKKKGDYRKALNSKEKQMAVIDSLNNIEFQKEIADLNLSYQTEKKELEIKKQKEELEKNQLIIKNNRLFSIIGILGVIIIASFVFAYFKRLKQRRVELQKLMTHRQHIHNITTKNKLQDQRIRISRDLHDNIGSQLTFIISSAENLQFLSKNADKRFKDKLRQITQFSKETIGQLRDTIWAMNKNEICIDDLQTRILSFIENAKNSDESIAIQFNNEISEEICLSSIAGINVFRVIQEAINNAIKHSEARIINVGMKISRDKFVVEINDDGLGFDLSTVEQGNGLDNMQNRIEEVDGVFNLKTAPKMGTRIRISLSKNTTNDV